jgi:TRAP-type C4-dicarboxylate transport system substrate-binding protein
MGALVMAGDVKTQIVDGLRSTLSSKWDSLSEEAKTAIETTAAYAAKLAAKEAAGDVEYAKKNAKQIASMLKDVEAIAAIQVTQAFWETVHKIAGVVGTILASAAKSALGLP